MEYLCCTRQVRISMNSIDKKQDHPFPSEYSRFEENGDCLVIDRPDTPTPWENFLFTRDGNFRVNISQRAKGEITYSCKDANLVGIGRNYCILDRHSSSCFSLNAGDAPSNPDYYRCEHRPGSTTIVTSKDGIQARLEVAVSPGEPLEVNCVKIENCSDSIRQICLIGYYEVKLEGIQNSQQLDKSSFVKDKCSRGKCNK